MTTCKHPACPPGSCPCAAEVVAETALGWEPEQTYPRVPESWKEET